MMMIMETVDVVVVVEEVMMIAFDDGSCAGSDGSVGCDWRW